jgi:hypothetical protein
VVLANRLIASAVLIKKAMIKKAMINAGNDRKAMTKKAMTGRMPIPHGFLSKPKRMQPLLARDTETGKI